MGFLGALDGSVDGRDDNSSGLSLLATEPGMHECAWRWSRPFWRR